MSWKRSFGWEIHRLMKIYGKIVLRYRLRRTRAAINWIVFALELFHRDEIIGKTSNVDCTKVNDIKKAVKSTDVVVGDGETSLWSKTKKLHKKLFGLCIKPLSSLPKIPKALRMAKINFRSSHLSCEDPFDLQFTPKQDLYFTFVHIHILQPSSSSAFTLELSKRNSQSICKLIFPELLKMEKNGL